MSFVSAIAVAAGGRVPPLAIVTSTAIAWWSARWPDMANPKSRPGRRLARSAPTLAGLIQWDDGRPDAGHRRNWSHSLLFGLLIAAIGGCLAVFAAGPWWWWIGAMVGMSWMMHILADCLTYQGAAVLYPVSCRVLRPRYGARMQSGGRVERAVVMPIVLALWVLAVVAMVIAR